MKVNLEDILRDTSIDSLPQDWQIGDFARFSSKKCLFSFQQNALQNALKALWLFYAGDTKNNNAPRSEREGKKHLYQQYARHYYASGSQTKELDKILNKNNVKNLREYFAEYSEDFPIIEGKVSFEHFTNMMSFWMATGSGKTLVIVKLIELLGKLIKAELIPRKDILFLAHRDDLLQQFSRHVDEYNSYNVSAKINLVKLRDYEQVKLENPLSYYPNAVNVFYYRSDLISDEQKENIINFRNYDNNGKWFVLLDEAHKGNKGESKRQTIYSILARQGFLFNFSATFTEAIDQIACGYNYNLAKFVENGFSKHIYVSDRSIEGFKEENDFSALEKQKVVLKSLLLYTYINKHYESIKKLKSGLYHKPLLLTLVNSVNLNKEAASKAPDLKMFFSELEKIAMQLDNSLLDEVKTTLAEELSKVTYLFEDDKEQFIFDKKLLKGLTHNDILQAVFNASKPGKLEVLKIPENNKELAFKLQTSDKAFALIKIGDTAKWAKELLTGYEFVEKMENKSIFAQLNKDDSDINLLMGSRAFYEGWDSTRPNILLFINIGTNKIAKKFVLQSVGRGVRIEPQADKRKRMRFLQADNLSNEQEFALVKNYISSIETLFIFGTSYENLLDVIGTLNNQKTEFNLGDDLIENEMMNGKELYIPLYKVSQSTLAESKGKFRYSISERDLSLVTKFMQKLDDRILLMMHDELMPNSLQIVTNSLSSDDEQKKHYRTSDEVASLGKPETLSTRVLEFFGKKNQDFDKLEKLGKEIVHFKHIKFNLPNRIKDIKEKIEQVNRYKKSAQLSFDYGSDLNIKYLANHYYLPLLVSERDKIKHLTHIIDVPSEIKFVGKLEKSVSELDNNFDWWMFSKLDETLDNIVIPYFNPDKNDMANYHPDFIFWFKKEDLYNIVFVDPKGTFYTDYQHRLDGYKNIFEEGNEVTVFTHNNLKVKVFLFFFTENIGAVSNAYKSYWMENISDLIDKTTS